MNNKYTYEKFESLEECLLWCAENKPITYTTGQLDDHAMSWSVGNIKIWWESWHKAIPVKEKKLRRFPLNEIDEIGRWKNPKKH